MQDAAVLVVGNLGIRVQTARHHERLAAVSGHRHILVDLELTALSVNIEFLVAGKSESVGVLALLELEGQDAHADQIAAVDSFVALGDGGFDTL